MERITKIQRSTAITANLLAVFALFMGSLLPVFAPTAQATSSQSLQQRANDASSRVGAMEQSLSTAMNALTAASRELYETEAQIAETEEQAQQIQSDIDRGREDLARQADFWYRNAGLGYLELIFSSESLTDLTARLELVGMLADNEAQTIRDLRMQTAQLDATLEDLEQLQDRQAQVAAARRADANSAQRLLNEQQAYVNSLNSQVQEALQREQDAANRQAATRAAATSGSNSEPGSGSTGGGSNSGSGTGGSYIATGMTFSGIASWYEVGTRTANGERFNPNAMTAAHKTLPFGTLVRVTFRGNSVVVRINDRGPFTGGRIIDLSRGAADAIGLRSAGIGTVTVEVVQRP